MLKIITPLFKKKDFKALPKHQPWDYKIKFILNKQSTFKPFYKSSVAELKFFKKYLNKNLKKGFIKKL